MSNLITTLSTWGTTASCIQSLCCCFRDENNHLSTWNMSSPKNIQGTTSKVKWCPWMPVGVTDTPREEKWKTNRRKKGKEMKGSCRKKGRDKRGIKEMHLTSCSCSRAPPPQAECVPVWNSQNRRSGDGKRPTQLMQDI